MLARVISDPFNYISLIRVSLLTAMAISIWIILLKSPGIKVSDPKFWKFLIMSSLIISGLLKRKNIPMIQEKAYLYWIILP